MPEISAQLSEEEVKELDKLVDYGVFNNKDDAINVSIKLLIRQEEIKKDDLINGMATVNDFLMDNLGDLPFADEPVIIYHDNKKIYKFPVKTRLDWKKNILLGFICIDSETFEIIPEMSDSAEKLNKVCDNIAHSTAGSIL